jgi:hypothetical protein
MGSCLPMVNFLTFPRAHVLNFGNDPLFANFTSTNYEGIRQYYNSQSVTDVCGTQYVDTSSAGWPDTVLTSELS